MPPLWRPAQRTGKQPPLELPPYAFEWADLGDGQGWPKALAAPPGAGMWWACALHWGWDTANEPNLGPPRFD